VTARIDPEGTAMAAPTRRPLLFSAFVMNTTSHIVQGTWRRPDAGQTDFNSLEHWVRGMVTDREPVVRDLGLLMAHNNRVAGTPEQIADRLASGATPAWTGSTW